MAKTFETPTWEGSFEDGVDTVIRAHGDFEWIVNPSTRPLVEPRTYRELADEPYETTTLDGTTAGPGEHSDHEFVLGQDVDLWRTQLDWGTPDDLDLEVYRKEGGELVEVGSSGNAPGSKESVDLTGAEAGTYVLRVINYASASPSYILTESFFDARTRTTGGTRESYVFTCEKRGRVLQRERVFVDRGDRVRLDLTECRRKA